MVFILQSAGRTISDRPVVLWRTGLFTWFLLISYVTDMIDGFLARKLRITSARGSQLDSLGDQITFVVGLTGLLVFEFDFIKENYLLLLLIFIPYIVQMLIAFRKYGKATAFIPIWQNYRPWYKGYLSCGCCFLAPSTGCFIQPLYWEFWKP